MKFGLFMDPSSSLSVQTHIAEYQGRMMSAIKSGMRQAMTDLSWAAAEQMQADGIVSRTGRLLGTILGSVRVSSKGTQVKGSVTAANKADPVGLWLEAGTHVPLVAGRLMVFFTPGGDLVFTHRHAAFNMPARPFMSQALAAQEANIMERIRAAAAQVEP